MGSAELYENYQSWCRDLHLQPFASREFNQIVKTELEVNLGLKYRHDLQDEIRWMRGWKGLALVDTNEVANVKNGSAESVGHG